MKKMDKLANFILLYVIGLVLFFFAVHAVHSFIERKIYMPGTYEESQMNIQGLKEA